jgi:hypothetical protein
MRMHCSERIGVEKMMEPSFEKLLARLAEAEVEFLLVGGLAVALNGYVRLTEDVDILVQTSPGNLVRLLDVLSAFGEGHGGDLTTADFDDEPGAIRVVEESESCQVDIFTVMAGGKYEDFISDAETTRLRGLAVRYASKLTLIRFKSGSVREKDRIDVIALTGLLKK